MDVDPAAAIIAARERERDRGREDRDERRSLGRRDRDKDRERERERERGGGERDRRDRDGDRDGHRQRHRDRKDGDDDSRRRSHREGRDRERDSREDARSRDHHHHSSHRSSHRSRRESERDGNGEGDGADLGRRSRTSDRKRARGHSSRSRSRSRSRSGSPRRPHKTRRDRAEGEEEKEEEEEELGGVGGSEPDPRAGTDTARRAAWMQAPSALDVDYVQRRPRDEKEPKKTMLGLAEGELGGSKMEINKALLKNRSEGGGDDDRGDGGMDVDQHQPAAASSAGVSYSFGDSGSDWRMTKLRAVYRQAEQTGRPAEEIGREVFGSVRAFDDVREEEVELDRRERYRDGYEMRTKPSGKFYQERLAAGYVGSGGEEMDASDDEDDEDGGDRSRSIAGDGADDVPTAPVDATTLNRLKAQLMKAKLRRDPNVAQLEAEYNRAAAAGTSKEKADSARRRGDNLLSTVSGREAHVLAAAAVGKDEAASLDVRTRSGRINKKATEKAAEKREEDMTIAELAKHERQTRSSAGAGGGAANRQLAERIARDGDFVNDLDYIDDQASKLARRVARSEVHVRADAIGEIGKMSAALDACPLCRREDLGRGPVAPVIALGERVYLTLTAEPDLIEPEGGGGGGGGGSAGDSDRAAEAGGVSLSIVPVQHHRNLLECEDEEWEEIRNFMKSVTRMFHAHGGQGVVFYENAARPGRRGHAAMVAVGVPGDKVGEAPAYFREAILAAKEEWAQHRPVIDTLAGSRGGGGAASRGGVTRGSAAGLGRWAFRRMMSPEMPYFHVWFHLDGGFGHVVENDEKWPKGDRFGREVLAGMLDVSVLVARDRGPGWGRRGGGRERDRAEGRLARAKRWWKPFDWTAMLAQPGSD